jgi:putative alpha-1,2-mannosidase
LTVVADGLSDAHPYVARVTLNGKALDRVWISDAEVRAGASCASP